ncbi:hypothetical protein GOP47_0013867 [Adiantum capillus-veneris]|uniref:Uncharacterized protein n=1 Tax=Adiantum capillus-veneris TaxID=13818 RepID=A0A9D4UPJ6_ADICA|nr:hypothetical protein GOP47_0013867 [Adiantum capillus-veneris]
MSQEDHENLVFEDVESRVESNLLPQVLEMLKKQGLMVCKVFFHIKPFVFHFELKPNLSERFSTANWWSTLIMEMFLKYVMMVTELKVADASNLEVSKVGEAKPEISFSYFLNFEIAN